MTELFDEARGEKRKKEKEKNSGKKKKNKKNNLVVNEYGIKVYQPNHLPELLTKNPRELVDYEKDFIDERIETGDAYTQTGTLLYMPPTQVPVTVWDPSTVKPDASFAIFGRRGTGKSYLTRDILYTFRDFFDHGMIQTGTKFNYFFQRVPPEKRPEDVRDQPNGFIPEKAVIDHYDPQLIENFLNMQADIRVNRKKWKEKHYDLPAFIWLDDVIDDERIRRDGIAGHLLALFSKGRHYKVMVGINTQYPKAIPSRMRDNLDYAILMRLDSKMEKDAVYEHFLGDLPRRTAEELLRMYTHGVPGGPKQCLVINMQACVPFHEKYMTYTANDNVEEFEVGSEHFWKEMGYKEDNALAATPVGD